MNVDRLPERNKNTKSLISKTIIKSVSMKCK